MDGVMDEQAQRALLRQNDYLERLVVQLMAATGVHHAVDTTSPASLDAFIDAVDAALDAAGPPAAPPAPPPPRTPSVGALAEPGHAEPVRVRSAAREPVPRPRAGILAVATPSQPPRPSRTTGPAVAPITFEPGEPTLLDEFRGQLRVIEFLTMSVRAMDEDQLAIRPILLLGPSGLGKTTIAKALAHELRQRAARLGLPTPDYIFTMPTSVPNAAALDDVLRRVQQHPGSMLFIDEAHDMGNEPHWRKLYPLLIENKYHFEGEPDPVRLPSVTVVTATTDYGSLPEPMRNRFTSLRVVPATPEELRHMLRHRPFPISIPAADLLIARVGQAGVPREVLDVYQQAVVWAKGTGRDYIGIPEVMQTFENQGIDQHGLRPCDRAVLELLFRAPRFRRTRGGGQEFVCFAQGTDTITNTLQEDPNFFIKNIQPRLMMRGLLEIRSGYGRALTKRAEELYAELNPTPYTSP